MTPSTAVRRMGPGVARRPLLAGADPVGALAGLLDRRAAAYETADVWIETEHRTRDEVADAICAEAERLPG